MQNSKKIEDETSDENNLSRDNLLGVILCGGSSSRMGYDKGLIRTKNQFWAASIASILDPFVKSSVFSIRSDQEKEYRRVLGDVDFVFDELNISGPLNGILSAHRKHRDMDLLVVACDMQKITGEIIGSLIRARNEHRQEYFFVFENSDGYIEPLCGIYRAGGLSGISISESAERSRYSVSGIIRAGPAFILKPETVHETLGMKIKGDDYFRNFNSRSDIETYQDMESVRDGDET